MGFTEILTEFVKKHIERDPNALQTIADRVRETVPDFTRRRLDGLLGRQRPREHIEIEPLARALNVHARQLTAGTPQERRIADYAVTWYKTPDMVERFYQFVETSPAFREGTSDRDLDTLRLAFEEDDRPRTEHDVFG